MRGLLMHPSSLLVEQVSSHGELLSSTREKIAIKASWPTLAAAQPPMVMILRVNVAHHP